MNDNYILVYKQSLIIKIKNKIEYKFQKLDKKLEIGINKHIFYIYYNNIAKQKIINRILNFNPHDHIGKRIKYIISSPKLKIHKIKIINDETIFVYPGKEI